MFDQKTLFRIGLATATAVAIAYVYGKITARDDTSDNSTKYATRAIVLAVISNLVAAYFLDSVAVAETVMNEPFYAAAHVALPPS